VKIQCFLYASHYSSTMFFRSINQAFALSKLILTGSYVY
jgi:hypothetical protein